MYARVYDYDLTLQWPYVIESITRALWKKKKIYHYVNGVIDNDIAVTIYCFLSSINQCANTIATLHDTFSSDLSSSH